MSDLGGRLPNLSLPERRMHKRTQALILGFCFVTGPWEEICDQYPMLPHRRVKDSLFFKIYFSQWRQIAGEGVFSAALEAFRERGEWVRKGRLAKAKGFEWQDLRARGLLLIPPYSLIK